MRRRELMTLALFSKAVAARTAAGAVAALPLTLFRVVQSCSPAVADIIGARAWTVAMTVNAAPRKAAPIAGAARGRSVHASSAPRVPARLFP